MSYAILIPFIVYLLVMMGIGAYWSRLASSIEGFYLGGRSLGAWVTAFSYAFSGMSAWVLIGYVGMVYKLGPSSFYILIGFNIGFILGYMVYAKRLRNYSEQLGAVTYTDFFVRRARTCTHAIRLISGIAIVVFMAAYVASQLAAAGKTMSVVFSVTPTTAILVTAVVVTLYCVFGGFMAVSVTDFVQGLVIVVGVMILAVVMLDMGGGPSAIARKAAEIDPNLVNASMGGKTGMAFIGAVIGYLGFAFQVMGRPHDTVRFFAIKSVSEIRKSLVVCLASLTVTYWSAFVVGYAGRVLFPGLGDPEKLFATVLTSNGVSPWFGGTLLAVFMGLLMSTVDSQLLSSASTLAEDLYVKYFGKHLTERQAITVTRVAIVIVAAIGSAIAITTPQSVFVLTNYASSGLAATYAPVLFLALYWKRLSGPGVVAGMIGGFSSVVIWQQFPSLLALSVPALPGCVMGGLIAVAVSLMTPQSSQIEAEVEREINMAKRDLDYGTDKLDAEDMVIEQPSGY